MRAKQRNAVLANANRTPLSSIGRHSPDRAHQALAQAFLRRSGRMLERVSSSASPEALKSALSSPTDVGEASAKIWPGPDQLNGNSESFASRQNLRLALIPLKCERT